jgi:adenylate cyclase
MAAKILLLRASSKSAQPTPVKQPRRTDRASHRHAVREELDRIFASPDFDASQRSREFLRFIVQEALAGRGDALTQAQIATRAFGRRDDFDPTVDPIVRIQAGRLRRSLERYYLLGGTGDPMRIELPRGTYVPVFRPLGEEAGETGQATRPAEPPAVPGTDWPAVAVGAFENHTGDPAQGETASRLSEELAAELGRYRDVRVVLPGGTEEPPRRARARFTLDGRIRGGRGELRVAARLVDDSAGEQVWADEYNTAPEAGRWSGSPDDIAHVIAACIGSENGVIVQALAREYRRVSPSEQTPFGAILGSHHFFLTRDPRDLPPVVEALRRVVATEPGIGPAWTQLARLCMANFAFEITGLETPIDQTIGYAQNGVRLEPTSTRARCVLASALLIKGELAAARDELEQALRLNPRSLVYLDVVGWLLAMVGDWERGIALARRAVDRNPHFLPLICVAFWADHLRRGELEQAHRAALELRDPIFFWRPMMRACALGHLGRRDEASAEVAELMDRKPDFPERGRVLIGRYVKFPDLMERVAEGLAKAGLVLR